MPCKATSVLIRHGPVCRFFVCGGKMLKVLIIVYIICYARYMEGTHTGKGAKNAKDVE